ncbi:MAG: 50S ribosomal protein L30e [Thermoproteota archaeon]|nr:50S ribosomal protein L30e [Thermoproteota archaeon]
MTDIDRAIINVLKTGKVLFGANNAVKNGKIGKAKLIVVAANCPSRVREDIEYYCKLSKVPVITYEGTGVDLARACRKPFLISALTIRDAGESDILRLAKNLKAEEADG